MQAAFQRTVDLGIPLDAQWGDIDIMERCQRQEKFFGQILGHWTSLLTKRTLLVCLILLETSSQWVTSLLQSLILDSAVENHPAVIHLLRPVKKTMSGSLGKTGNQ